MNKERCSWLCIKPCVHDGIPKSVISNEQFEDVCAFFQLFFETQFWYNLSAKRPYLLHSTHLFFLSFILLRADWVKPSKISRHVIVISLVSLLYSKYIHTYIYTHTSAHTHICLSSFYCIEFWAHGCVGAFKIFTETYS